MRKSHHQRISQATENRQAGTPASDVSVNKNDSQFIGEHEPWEQRAKGVEPSTFTLARGEHHTVSTADTSLTTDDKRACTSDCIPDTKTGSNKVQAGSLTGNFAEALALIAKLPLTKAEKAEAVRRLLGSNGVIK